MKFAEANKMRILTCIMLSMIIPMIAISSFVSYSNKEDIVAGVADAITGTLGIPEVEVVQKRSRASEVVVDNDILFAGDEYYETVNTYSTGVMGRLNLSVAHVYDYCGEPEYGGYAVHIMFDDVRYQCIWVNSDNMECLVLYDCDLTNPVYQRIFY